MKQYEYTVNGIVHVAQMDAETAERYGATEVKATKAPTAKAAKAPENKAG